MTNLKGKNGTNDESVAKDIKTNSAGKEEIIATCFF